MSGLVPVPRKRFKFWKCPHCGMRISHRTQFVYGCKGCDVEWRWRGFKKTPRWLVWGVWRDRYESGRIRS